MTKTLSCSDRSIGESAQAAPGCSSSITGLLRKDQEPEPGKKDGWTWSTGEVRNRGAISKAERTHGYHESREESQVQTSACQSSQEGAGKVWNPAQSVQVSR